MSASNGNAQNALGDNPATNYQILKRFKNKRNLHVYLTKPTVTKGDRIVHTLNFLSCAVKDTPVTSHHEQLTTILKLGTLFTSWTPKTTAILPSTPSPTHQCLIIPFGAQSSVQSVWCVFEPAPSIYVRAALLTP